MHVGSLVKHGVDSMKCKICEGVVTWRGPLYNLTLTKCENCGAHNSQEANSEADEACSECGQIDCNGECCSGGGVGD